MIHSLSNTGHETVKWEHLAFNTKFMFTTIFLFHCESPYGQLLHKVLTYSFKFLFGLNRAFVLSLHCS